MRCAALALGMTLLGAAPPDFDKDGVPDTVDDCPTDPGDAALRGCPGETPPARKPPEASTGPPAPLVEASADRLDLREPIRFQSGSARISPASAPLLKEIAKAVRTLPKGSIVSVEGHTDDRGRRRDNLRLSLQRAEAVVRALVGRGVPAARLRAVGHGPDHPVASNARTAGRAKNRRVEFLIER